VVKLVKNKCEIECCNEVLNLEFHHIIPRTDPLCTNKPENIAILCPVHHALTHSGQLILLGVFPATKPPNNRILVYSLYGNKNIDIDIQYYNIKPKTYKI
jgi:hypothetical protein